MKQTTIQIRCDDRRLEALRHYMGQKSPTPEAELEDCLNQLFQKYIPKNLHEFLLKKPRDG